MRKIVTFIFISLLFASGCSNVTNSTGKPGDNSPGNNSGGNSGGGTASPPSLEWHVSLAGNTMAKVLSQIKAAYKSGALKPGESAVIVISGTIKAPGTSNGMVDISGSGYPPIVLQGDPALGGVLDAGGKSRILYVGDGNTVTLDAGLTLTGGDALNGGAVFVKDHGRFVMKGGTISNNLAENGGAIAVTDFSTVEISGGIISGNKLKKQGNGSGIYVDYESTVTMTDGFITGNGDANTKDGGGVFINGHGTFILDGGEISGNIASEEGGGVKVGPQGICTQQGGTITGNTAKSGGGVYVSVHYKGQYNQLGGTVSGNIPDDVINQ